MHATIDVRFELSIDDDKTLPLATLAEAVTDQNLEAVLLESLVETSTPPASRRSVVRNTHMATVTSASNAPAPTPAQLSQLPENTSSPLRRRYSRFPRRIQLFPARRRRSRLRRAEPLSAGHRRQKRRSATSLSYRDAANHGDSFVSMPSPTTINRRAKKYGHKLKQFQTRLCRAQTLTPSFLTGQSATAKTTTARPTPSKQRSAKTPPKSHAPCWICRSTLTGTKLPPNSMISAQSLTTRRSSVTLIAASSQPLPTKTVTTSSIRPRRPNAGLHPLGRWRLPGPSEGDRFEVIDEVFHLKNSVAKHRPAEEFAAIRSRIARTRERLEKTAWQLEQFGSAKAAGYLRRWLPSIVTFAEHAVEGFEVPGPRTPSND